MELTAVLGNLYFKKALFELKDFNDKTKINGIAIEVESDVQRRSITVYMIGKYNQTTIEQLNSRQETFNASVKLMDPILMLKDGNKYRLECVGINF